MDDNSKQNNDIFDENCCIKCLDPKSGQEELSVITRGLDKLTQYSDFIQDKRLRLYLLDSEKNGVTVKIHRSCQKANEMKCKGDTVPTTFKKIHRVTQSDVTEFNWKTHCFKQSVLKTFHQRNDKWVEEVRVRVLDCNALVASEARYHITFIKRFSLNKYQKSSNASTVGRLVCNIEQESFNVLCKWLESVAEIYSLSKIQSKMSFIQLRKIKKVNSGFPII